MASSTEPTAGAASDVRPQSVTIREVAAQADVSQATAARALGGYGYVSATARRRVEDAAAELGYRPNDVARALASGLDEDDRPDRRRHREPLLRGARARRRQRRRGRGVHAPARELGRGHRPRAQGGGGVPDAAHRRPDHRPRHGDGGPPPAPRGAPDRVRRPGDPRAARRHGHGDERPGRGGGDGASDLARAPADRRRHRLAGDPLDRAAPARLPERAACRRARGRREPDLVRRLHAGRRLRGGASSPRPGPTAPTPCSRRATS